MLIKAAALTYIVNNYRRLKKELGKAASHIKPKFNRTDIIGGAKLFIGFWLLMPIIAFFMWMFGY